MKKNNNKYILLLLCVLLIFILIIQNRKESFQVSYEKEKDKWETRNQEKFNRQEKELKSFIDENDITLTEPLNMILDLKYEQNLTNTDLNKLKENLRIFNVNREKIHLIYKLNENNDNKQLHISFASIIISFEKNKIVLISKSLFIRSPTQLIPNVNFMPDGDEKYKELNKKFETKIGPMPNPKECVIS